MADAGVVASESTVRRELAARAQERVLDRSGQRLPNRLERTLEKQPSGLQDLRGGREIAAEWMGNHISNPLLRAKLGR